MNQVGNANIHKNSLQHVLAQWNSKYMFVILVHIRIYACLQDLVLYAPTSGTVWAVHTLEPDASTFPLA